MIRFNSDYCEGAHPRLLEKLISTNMEQTSGYGEDPYCRRAAETIRGLCHAPASSVHFLVGGTQTNLIVIASALRPHQGALCADTGHIQVHETGAVEASGHKVLPLPSVDGKITAKQVAAYCESHIHNAAFEHTVQPGLVYISHPTELGTIYSKAELTALHDVCQTYGLYLFLDGARLAYGLAADGADLTLPDLARLCDVFYIGGTKVGALFGEAVVISHPALQKDFRYIMKQRGAMLAKGRLLGIQFEELFTDGLYFAMGKHAVSLAMQLKTAFADAGFSFLVDSPTNQQFVILPDAILKKLSEDFAFEYQQRVDDSHSAVRFCTSWATKPEDVNALIQVIQTYSDF